MNYHDRDKGPTLEQIAELRKALDAAQIALEDALGEARTYCSACYWPRYSFAEAAKAGGVSRSTGFLWADRAAERAKAAKAGKP